MGLQAGAERQENMVAQYHRRPPKSIERYQEQGKNVLDCLRQDCRSSGEGKGLSWEVEVGGR